MFHDADARRLCGSPTVIGRSTLAELGRLRLGDRSDPDACRACSTLVGGRVPLLLEVKVDGDLWRFGPALVAALDGYRRAVRRDELRSRACRAGSRPMRPHVPPRAGRSRIGLRRSGVGWAMRLADPEFLAVEVAALGKPWVAARAPPHAGLQLDGPHPRRARASRGSRRRADLGSRWPTVKPSSPRGSRARSPRSTPRAVGRAGRRRRPVPQPCLPRRCSKLRAASARASGWTPAADPGRARRPAQSPPPRPI